MAQAETQPRLTAAQRLALGVAVAGLAAAFVGLNLMMGAAEKESADTPYTARQRVEGALGAWMTVGGLPLLVFGVLVRSSKPQVIVSVVGLGIEVFGLAYVPEFLRF